MVVAVRGLERAIVASEGGAVGGSGVVMQSDCLCVRFACVACVLCVVCCVWCYLLALGVRTRHARGLRTCERRYKGALGTNYYPLHGHFCTLAIHIAL